MEQTGWYNGYDWSERAAKLKELKLRIARGELQQASGPCALCNDPEVAVEYHDEDYSKEYRWSPPALLALCRNCHRDKLHKRFLRPSSWLAFLAHVRRGGYARDLKDPAVKKEVASCRAALESRENFVLRQLRPYRITLGTEWFALLSLDPASMTDPKSRPRP